VSFSLLPIAHEPLPPGPAAACPVCGVEGQIWLRDARDTCGFIEGAWTYRRCGACATVWMDPRPAPEQIATFYPGVYYTHSAANDTTAALPRSRLIKDAILRARFGYADPLPSPSAANGLIASLTGSLAWYRDMAGYDIRYVPRVPGGRLLDVGCGSGEFMRRMAALGWDVEGLDPDPLAVEVAKKSGHRVVCSTIEHAPNPAELFDAVTLSHVFEHVTDPAWVLKKIFGWVKPGGQMTAIYPNAAGTLARWFGRDWVDLEPPRHLTFVAPATAAAIMTRLGARTEVRTLTRSCAPVIQQSLNFRRAGAAARYSPAGLKARLLERAARLIDALHGDRGNEVILIARKP